MLHKQIKITNKEAKIIIRGLFEAIESTETLIDAHKIEYAKGPNGYLKDMVVPNIYKKQVTSWNKSIGKFKNVIKKLIDETTGIKEIK